MQNQDLTYKAIYAKLTARTEKYASDVRKVFLDRMGEIAKLCDGVEVEEGKVFRFNDYPEISTKVQEHLRAMYSELYQCVRGDIVREWYYANDNVDRLVKAMFGKQAADNPHFAKYFQRNKQAMDAFFERKQQGLSLSQRIWQYVGEGKEELEFALDLGLGAGKSADQLSRDVRRYLQDPNKLFRRVRDKHGNLVLSKAAKAYHVGTGKYRSSYKNAMRLTRTETNMAYRTADITRWQQQPFVVGYTVKLSRKHPEPDICNDLAGDYPKGFMFKGWHPHCYCYIVPKLCTDKELEELTQRILDGTEDEFTPSGVVPDVPQGFKDWITNNEDRINSAKSLPYFIRDNYPKGDITKAGNWVAQGIPNEIGMGNFAQVVAKKDVELSMFNKVQGYSNTDWQNASNFVEQGTGELEQLLGGNTSGFDGMHKAIEPTTFNDLLKQASMGNVDAWAKLVDKAQLAELDHITKLEKFVSKADGRFVGTMERKQFEAMLSADGKQAQFTGVSKLGTHYTKAASKAVGADDEQVLVVVKTPTGSRYVQTIVGEEQQAVFMPNTKYKVVGKVEKTITKSGTASKVVQYELELVDDGSTQFFQLLNKQQQINKELTAHSMATKTANNVLKASKNGIYSRVDVDTSELGSMLTGGTATGAEIKSKTKEVAKELAKERKLMQQNIADASTLIADAKQWEALGVSTAQLEAAVATGTSTQIKNYTEGLKNAVAMAKQSLQDAYGEILQDPLALYQKLGKADFDSVFNAVSTKMQQWLTDPYHSNDLAWLKKKIEFEIDWVTKNKKYSTWQDAADAYKFQLQKVETKIQLQSLQTKIDDNITFALSTKSAKTKTLAAELQSLITADKVDVSAVQDKLTELEKEVDRLKKARKKFTSANASALANTDLTDEQFLKIGNDWAFDYLTNNPSIDLYKDKKGKLIQEIFDAGVDKDRAKMGAALKKLGVDLSDPYSPARKDYAVWCKSSAESHAKWDAACEAAWNSASAAERKAWHDYTQGSGHMNRPMRGYRGSWYNFEGVGKVDLDYEDGKENIKNLFNLINRQAATEDVWLQRGIESASGVAGFFGSSDFADISALVGKEFTDHSFVSCGSAKGTGFSGHCILNIFAPKGTKMQYVANHSVYRGENETILLSGTRFKLVKVQKSGSTIYADVEIVGYDAHPLPFD